MRILTMIVALTCVSNVAWAEAKTIKIRSFSVQDISEAVEGVADQNLHELKLRDAKFPVKKVKTVKTEPWMNMVQMNQDSVFFSLKF